MFTAMCIVNLLTIVRFYDAEIWYFLLEFSYFKCWDQAHAKL